MDRREFLKAGAAGLALSAVASYAVELADQKSKRVGLIGCGWYGKGALFRLLQIAPVEVVSLCDVDKKMLAEAAEMVAARQASKKKPRTYGDYREMLKEKDLDLVLIATPDHWHALVAIAALESGTHVFLEKPTGHTIGESRAIVNAANNTDHVLQMGLHRRIGPHHVSGMKFLKDGGAGDIGMVRMFVAGGGGTESPSPNARVPEGIDWDMYCGPAPLRPFNRKIHPGGWRNFLDFANGTLGDWGVHWLDQVLWWTDEKYPKRIFSTGGRPIRG